MTRTRLSAALLLAAGVAPGARADELDDWVRATAALKANDQLAAVRDKLRELNKEFGAKQGEVSGGVADGVVRELAVDAAYLVDIRPLRVLRDLEHLHCTPVVWDRVSKVADLAPLKGMRLKSLNVRFTAVADLSPLDGMPLERVNLLGTSVRSLKPLHKAPLTQIHLPLYVTGDDPKRPKAGHTPAADALFLADKKVTSFAADQFDANTANPNLNKNLVEIFKGSRESLEVVHIQFCALSDLKFLEGTPVRTADLRYCPNLASLKPLEKCPKLESLSLQLVKAPLDLAPLRNLPLTGLSLDECPGVTDLKPLAGMKTLKALSVRESGVRDLTPLAGCEGLERLNLGRLRVASLKPLAGCAKLSSLDLQGTAVADKDGFAPLGKLPLEAVLADVDKNGRPANPGLAKVLKSIPTLKLVNTRPADEVLK